VSDPKILTASEWIARALRLQEKHDSLNLGDRLQILTRTLVELNDLIRSAPSSVRQLFSEFPERELVMAAAEQRVTLERDQYGWRVPNRPEPLALIRSVSAQARAVDQLLYEERDHGFPIDPNVEWSCPGTDAFVIPRRAPRPTRRPLSNQPFVRRCLLKASYFTKPFRWLLDQTLCRGASRLKGLRVGGSSSGRRHVSVVQSDA
jgi:hypothetical protein